MELVLKQTQQGISYEVSVSAKGVEELKRKVKIKGEKKEALLTLRFYTSAGNPVKEILLKLNLPDHKILKDGGQDNNCTVEFDAFGFLVKDFLTHHILLRCDSSGDLYPVTSPSPTPHALLSVGPSTWNQHLGHPGEDVLRSFMPRQFISCNKEKSSHLCHACQLGKHVRLSFASSDSIVTCSFEIVHCDIWTSPIVSSGGFIYYVLLLDHYSHYLWIYPLRTKSEVFQKFLHFHSYVNNQFKCDIVAFQCDHGGYAYRVGFSSSRCDSSLFIYQYGSEGAYLLIYVGDIILTASSTDLLQRIFSSFHTEFDMTNLGALNYFLGISVMRDSTCMFLSQKKYALELLDMAHIANCYPTRTPVDTESKLGSNKDPIYDPTLYRSLAGGLQYLTFTHPYISYAVQQVCLNMHDPREPHLIALKRVL
ncbi:ribonuclease H-like domain-containing protein [Tanacetum coccineum]